MNVFVDANIIISTLNREYPLYTWSSRVLSLNDKKNIRLYTSPLCLAIAFYFASKKSGEKTAKKKIELLCQKISLTKIDEKITLQALNNPMVRDFEDGMEYYSAMDKNCDVIVTENKEDFYFGTIMITDCEGFLKNISTQLY